MSDIVHDLKLACSPAEAYAAVATDRGIKGWWSKNSDIASGVGETHTLRFQKDDRAVTMKFRIDALEEGRRVAWTCTENDNPVWPTTRLRFDIEPDGDGTRLRFQHTGFKEGTSPPYKMTVDGWPHFMASLKAYVETGKGMPA
jgi:uncharacterized protein YndB with AHSA1/START domain